MKSFRRNMEDNSGRWTRRSVLAALALPALVGCSSDQNSSASQLTAMLKQGGLNLFGRGQSATLSEVSAIPYATIGVRVGDSAQVVLVLASSSQDTHLWTSGAHIALETLHGRIMKTAGLPHNLSATVLSGPDPLANAGLLRRGGGVQRTVDLIDRNVYQTTISSRFSVVGPEDIDILGSAIKTLHVAEDCTCELLSWDFRNDYWLDPASGLVWRSQQNVHPDLDTIEVETLRPPAA